MKFREYEFTLKATVRVKAQQVDKPRQVYTSYGVQDVVPGDWIIDFENAGRSVCSDWLFKKKFKPVPTEPDLFEWVQA